MIFTNPGVLSTYEALQTKHIQLKKEQKSSGEKKAREIPEIIQGLDSSL